MPIYTDETTTREDLEKLSKTNQCKVCGGWLNLFRNPNTGAVILACNDWLRTHHEGIEREASRYEKEGLAALNIPKRREIMNQEFGEAKTKALDRYTGTVAITRRIATEIVETLWGKAPPIEKTKAILFCQTYQLNPLMKHLHLVGYRRRDKVTRKFILDANGKPILDWSIMIGIGATRLMAQRKHNYSYLDLTPRKATKEEINQILGDTADSKSIYAFVHIKDVDTGAEAFGLRGCALKEKIKNEEKGNTHLNMACVRAERLALDRQYPGEMPQGLEVFDERYMDTEYKVVDRATGEITESATEEAAIEGEFEEVGGPMDTTAQIPEPETKEHRCEEHGCAYELKRRGSSFWYAHKCETAPTGWCNEKKKEAAKAEVAEQDIEDFWQEDSSPEPGPAAPAASESAPVAEVKSNMDMAWLEGALNELKAKKLKYGTESNLLSYMEITYKIEAETVLEGATKLDKGQAAHFAKAIQDILDMA